MNNNNEFLNESAPWNDTTIPFIKIEPNDDYDDPPENMTINELKLKNEFNDSAILSTENVIIKEEINIDEIVFDESTTNTQNWESGQETDPLSVAPEKFECKICGECYTQSRQLNNHLFIIHRPLTEIGTGAFCNKCSKWFPEIKYPNHNPCFKYMRSIQNGKRMHSCEICDKDYSALSLLKIHLLECHRPLIVHENLELSEAILKQIVCNICGAVFPLKASLIHHLTLMHRPYTISGNGAFCTRCQTWFAEENFKDHRPCVTPVQSVVPMFSCNICCAEFKMLHLLKTHLYVIHRPLALQYCSDAFCDKCNRWFKEDNYTIHKCFRQLTTNIEMCNKYGFKCTVCSKVFKNDDEIKKHLYNVHRPVVTDEWDKVFCDFCKKCFDEDKFEEHVPCHSVDGKCVFCLIMMPSKEHYLLHDLTWKRWRSYQCNMCNLSTQEMRLANLNEHMINHGKKSIFSCVKCKFDFASTENAEAHIECFHLGCRCIMLPCICDTYNYDYYYEFVKQRNISDFRGNNKNLLENEISIIREKHYKLVESNIEVLHMKCEADILENSELNKFNFQVDCNNFQAIEIMPSTSTSTPTQMIMEDFSNGSPESNFNVTLSIKEEEEEEVAEENEMVEEIESKIDIVETKLEFFETNEAEQIETDNKVIPRLKNQRFANVVIERGLNGFGFTLLGQNPCKVDNVLPGSPADLVGLHNGDSIVEINGNNVLSFAHETVVNIIKKCTGNISMKIFLRTSNTEVTTVKAERISGIFLTKKRMFKCIICNIIFTSKDILNDHLIVKHKPTVEEEEVVSFRCNNCRKNFTEYLTFLYHDPCAVTKLNWCPICSIPKPTLAHLELHNLLYRNEEYVCTICSPLDRVAMSLDDMNEHRKTVHNRIGVYECLKCQINYGTFNGIAHHLNQHLKNNETMDAETFKLKGAAHFQQFKCKTCDKLVDTVRALEIHEKKHERQRLLCKICNKSFANATSLGKHELLHVKKQFFCDVCDCKFRSKRTLRQHSKVHREKKTFDCIKCGQNFDTYTSLICHMASHTHEHLFRCCVCNIKYDKQAQLSVHMQKHNDDDTNPNKCSICGRYFTHKCKLIVHSQTHPSDHKTNDDNIEKTQVSESSASNEEINNETESDKTINEHKRSNRKRKLTKNSINAEETERPKNKRGRKPKLKK